MSAADLCATVGCYHRRDEHYSDQWQSECRVGGDMHCERFTEPPTVAERYAPIAGHDFDIDGNVWPGSELARRLDAGEPTTWDAPSVAEHDDNLDLRETEGAQPLTTCECGWKSHEPIGGREWEHSWEIHRERLCPNRATPAFVAPVTKCACPGWRHLEGCPVRPGRELEV